MRKAYRIISIEAADIYRQEQENGVSVGYVMPEKKSDAYFKLFKIYLDIRCQQSSLIACSASSVFSIELMALG